MICKYCHHEISDTANFCEECGLSTKSDTIKGVDKVNPKRRTKWVSVIVAVLIVITAFISVFKFGGSTEKAIKGVWTGTAYSTNASENFTYTFLDGTGTSAYSGDNQNYNAKEAVFHWHITDEKDLVILWSSTSCTNYKWNPNYNSYKLSANEYNWYVKGDKLYLSTGSSELGYNEYTRQAKK